MSKDKQSFDWTAVIARCLAYLCLRHSEFSDKSKLEQARFLEKLGVPVKDGAGVVGSTPDSLGELARQERKRQEKTKKGVKRNGKRSSR